MSATPCPWDGLAAVLDALERESPGPVARGRAALGRALAWTATTAWPEVAWSFSDLAGGSPVELVWRPGRPGLFWTAEPAAPEWPAPRRLRRALALVRSLGAGFSASQTAGLDAALATTSAPWPVWVGGRHDAGGDSGKLYALSDHGRVPARRPDDRPVMLGLSVDGGLESYWRRSARRAGDRWRLARLPGLAGQAATLDAALRDWTGLGLDDTDGGCIGLSLKRSPTGAPECLAAFVRVHQAGGEQRVRHRLLAAGGEVNPTLAQCWAAGRLRPLLLSLVATDDTVTPAIGLRLI